MTMADDIFQGFFLYTGVPTLRGTIMTELNAHSYS